MDVLIKKCDTNWIGVFFFFVLCCVVEMLYM